MKGEFSKVSPHGMFVLWNFFLFWDLTYRGTRTGLGLHRFTTVGTQKEGGIKKYFNQKLFLWIDLYNRIFFILD